jgi:hypothetical protein
LERWRDRNVNEHHSMREIFDGARFFHDLDASLSVAEWSYERAERAGALVWAERGCTLRLNNQWRRILST